MPKLSSSLAMVPTRDNCGGAISFFRGGGGDLTGACSATAGGGGRLDGEKIGRSRVTDNCVSGMAHNGLALGVRSGATWGAAWGAATRTVVTGSAGSGDSAGG